MLRLTTASLARFAGGQIEVQNEGERYYYRGEIKSVEVTPQGDLSVKLNWMAKGKGDSHIPRGFINDSRLEYEANLGLYVASDIGPSSEGGGKRIALMSTIVGETVVLFPPDGSKLDPARVEGLNLAATPK